MNKRWAGVGEGARRKEGKDEKGREQQWGGSMGRVGSMPVARFMKIESGQRGWGGAMNTKGLLGEVGPHPRPPFDPLFPLSGVGARGGSFFHLPVLLTYKLRYQPTTLMNTPPLPYFATERNVVPEAPGDPIARRRRTPDFTEVAGPSPRRT
eukprot:767204-Hanusia_phi.AAC.4